MEIIRTLVLLVYFAVMAVLSLYGLHRLYLVIILLRRKRDAALSARTPVDHLVAERHAREGDADRCPSSAATGSRSSGSLAGSLPHVTVQIPIYNELNVAPRLIEAVSQLDYPRAKLEIQVLDDSTDETCELVADQVARLRHEGHDIHHVHRNERTGFKAGALAGGLDRARGEMIAVFDADFLPPPGFLRETLPYFEDSRVGMVQARWGHLNRNYSALTRVQALLLDGHFLVEHAARNISGCFFNFNGTAGVWRRSCIEDAGGWQHDTLTEDLDLSYRAQLAGWSFVFVPGTVAPAELPVAISAFKCQQHRWAKGSIQTARKLLPRVLASPYPLRVRAEAAFHLTANFGHVLMVALSVLLFPAMVLRVGTPWMSSLMIDLPLFAFSSLAFWIFYAVAEVQGGGRALRAVRTMPALMAIGVGLCLNNAKAVLEGLFGGAGTFERTPKHRIEDGRDDPPLVHYGTRTLHLPWVEGLFALYFTLCLAAAMLLSLWSFLPFLLVFWAGFSYMTVVSIAETSRRRRSRGEHRLHLLTSARHPRP